MENFPEAGSSESHILISRQNCIKNIVTDFVCFSVSKVFGPVLVLPAPVGEEHSVTQTKH